MSPSAHNVACCGSVVLDFIFEVERIPAHPEKTSAHGFREAGGGLAATGAVAIAAAGGSPEFWGRVGDDPAGQRLAEILASKGVAPRLRRSAGGRTPVSGMLVDRQGERMLAFFPGDALDPDPSWLPLERLDTFGAVLCDVRWPAAAAAVIQRARACNVPSVLDAELAPLADLEALAVLGDHVLFSAGALRRLTDVDDPLQALRAIRARVPGLVGVSLGAHGFVWLEDGRCWRQPAFAVEAVETNGAGDAFHGGYALALARGADPGTAARFASAIAALKCTRRGGWDSMPSAGEIDRLLAEQQANAPVPV